MVAAASGDVQVLPPHKYTIDLRRRRPIAYRRSGREEFRKLMKRECHSNGELDHFLGLLLVTRWGSRHCGLSLGRYQNGLRQPPDARIEEWEKIPFPRREQAPVLISLWKRTIRSTPFRMRPQRGLAGGCRRLYLTAREFSSMPLRRIDPPLLT